MSTSISISEADMFHVEQTLKSHNYTPFYLAEVLFSLAERFTYPPE